MYLHEEKQGRGWVRPEQLSGHDAGRMPSDGDGREGWIEVCRLPLVKGKV